MEKRTPHCALSVVKSLVQAGKVHSTFSAQNSAARMGVSVQKMIDIVTELTMADFYKSMTSYNDHTLWQDVYRPYTEFGDIYLKLTVADDVLIVSFKEL